MLILNLPPVKFLVFIMPGLIFILKLSPVKFLVFIMTGRIISFYQLGEIPISWRHFHKRKQPARVIQFVLLGFVCWTIYSTKYIYLFYLFTFVWKKLFETVPLLLCFLQTSSLFHSKLVVLFLLFKNLFSVCYTSRDTV